MCKHSPRELRGLALVELEHAAEALTTLDLVGSDHGCRGRDEFDAQTLVRTFFVIQVDNATPIVLSLGTCDIHGIRGSVGP